MADKYSCMKCKCAGAKTLVPYKVIKDSNGESVRFVGQLCERCFKELFEQKDELPHKSEETNKEE